MIFRTLKDYTLDARELLMIDTPICVTGALRREAIEWIRFFRNPPDGFIGIALEDISKGGSGKLMTSIDETFIKHFFNIKEEEISNA